MTESASAVDVCVHCGGHLVEGRGFLVCEDCGVESEDRIFTSSVHYDGGGRRRGITYDPTSPSYALAVGGLGSNVGYTMAVGSDVRGRPVNVDFFRLRRLNVIARYDGQETLAKSHDTLNRVCSALSLPETLRRRASYLLDTAVGRSDNRHGNLVVAAVYRASLDVDAVVPFETVLAAVNERVNVDDPARKIRRRHVMKAAGRLSSPIRPVTPTDFVDTIVGKLEADRGFRRLCTRRHVSPPEIVAELRRRTREVLDVRSWAGLRPYNIAAAAVWVADARYTSMRRRPKLVNYYVLGRVTGLSPESLQNSRLRIERGHGRGV